MKKLLTLTSAVLVSLSASAATPMKPKFITVEYEAFKVVLNCEKRGLELYTAIVGPDKGNRRREEADFKLDKNVPAECQQTSTGTYPPGYHRGHLEGANTAENSRKAYLETFYMTNILPMTKQLNTGAWHYTDQMIECLRDTGPELLVMSGTIWEGPHASSRTVATHGAPIPSGFWRIIKKGEKQVAWIFPNSTTPIKRTLPKWESTVDEIEKVIGYSLNADFDLYRNYRPDTWYQVKGCDLS